MPHWSITGISGCGKSRLLREVILPAHRRCGRHIVVLDPVGQAWPASLVTDDPFRLSAIARASVGLVIVVDEFRFFAKDYRALCELEWLFTVGRNRGLLCYAAAQRMMMIPPNVRDQCQNAVIFRQPRASLAQLVEQYNEPAIYAAETLPAGHALVIEPFRPVRTIRQAWAVKEPPGRNNKHRTLKNT